MKLYATIFALALFAVACDRPDFGTQAETGDVVDTDVDREAPGEPTSDASGDESPNANTANNEVARNNQEEPPDEGVSSPMNGFAAIVDANASLGFSAYHALASEDGSLVVGAYGLTRAASVASLGASGTARADLEEKVATGLLGDELHTAFNTLDYDLTTRASTTTLDLVTATWVPQSAEVEQEFVDDLARYYGLSVRRAPFETRPEDARVTINNFYRDETGGELTDVVPQRAIDATTQVLVTDGNVFRGAFEDAFDPQYTETTPFTGSTGTRAVPMMLREGTVMGMSRTGFRAIELPFDDGFSLLLILPDEGKFDAVESGFDPAFVESILADMVPSYLVIGLPRISVASRIDALELSSDLGLDNVFNSDFSAVFPDARLSNIAQRTRLTIAEDGVNADPVMLPPLNEMEADSADVPSIFFSRSFLFVVRDTETGTILFLGRYD